MGDTDTEMPFNIEEFKRDLWTEDLRRMFPKITCNGCECAGYCECASQGLEATKLQLGNARYEAAELRTMLTLYASPDYANEMLQDLARLNAEVGHVQPNGCV